MMRIHLHIGLPQTGADRIQSVLNSHRDRLSEDGVCYPHAPGDTDHSVLFMAATDPAHMDELRFDAGLETAGDQDAMRDQFTQRLAQEIAVQEPDVLVLSCPRLAWLATQTERMRLRDILAHFSSDIRITAYVDSPAQLLARTYAAQVLSGRHRGLDLEHSLADAPDWWEACAGAAPDLDPIAGQFLETQTPPFWLDYAGLVSRWDAVFGPGSLRLRPYDPKLFASAALGAEIQNAFDLDTTLPCAADTSTDAPPSAATLARARQFNALILPVLTQRKRRVPLPIWREFLEDMAVYGHPTNPQDLFNITVQAVVKSKYLSKSHDLPDAMFDQTDTQAIWQEADPTRGYRASQYLLKHAWRIDKATRQARRAAKQTAALAPVPVVAAPSQDISDTARAILPAAAIEGFDKLRRSRYAPHDRIGPQNEASVAPAFTDMPPRKLPKGSSGRVIVGCMKNEGPYILEWVAYHRAIGVDNFLIYTNGCEDGTDEILDRLQELDLLQHRLNDDWKGKSPQQYALNKSLKEPVIRNAEWLIHIDVDEFINVRCGNGTLDDFLALAPDATNVAMTWRLFGHGGIADFDDRPVTAQFDLCAPKFCPKPHTVWGFKTMVRNTGAYEKLSCHRPNKLDPDWKDKVRWVNGSAGDITGEMAERGWRSSTKSVGYDHLQLNHYALRSIDSFLIKRQRGRALHVDRSIGLNYWVRMDWSDHRDLSIQRNLPRMNAELARLLADPVLADWHARACDWHRAKAVELKANPEFRDLYEHIQTIKLTPTERVAYALALDMES